ncbi:glycine cleavage system H protein [Teladorsagia circumcincta]|uniref:Glycine cleavage system H protein n=1 Tax=Teladorsagia circumcincta TaxID=45464 RepID=A0A2G9UD91_TELCI|nr:glycine cleavage system H protein [Teladorsagia circumcincta]
MESLEVLILADVLGGCVAGMALMLLWSVDRILRELAHRDPDWAKRKYTKKHEWVSVEGDLGTVGITDFAAEQLGDIVFVELPEKDAKIVKGESTGAVESVKAASDIYAPVSGTVTEKNEVLEQEPGKINKSPFDDGWLYKLKLSNKSELSDLLSEKEYQEFKKEDEGHE